MLKGNVCKPTYSPTPMDLVNTVIPGKHYYYYFLFCYFLLSASICVTFVPLKATTQMQAIIIISYWLDIESVYLIKFIFSFVHVHAF